jgi:hypothetical protein
VSGAPGPRWSTAIALLLLTMVACDRGGATGPSRPSGLSLAEVITGPLVDPDGLVFSVALRNGTDQPIRVTDVEVVTGEDVVADVLGASTCSGGCAGAMAWRDAAPMLEKSIEWRDDFVVPSAVAVDAGQADPVKVVLRVRPVGPAAGDHLVDDCLFVRKLRVAVDDGPLRTVPNHHASFVVALDRPDAGQPGIPHGCGLAD